MEIKVIVDKFCQKKGLKDKMMLDMTKPIVPQIYEFLCGNKYDEEFFDRVMRCGDDGKTSNL